MSNFEVISSCTGDRHVKQAPNFPAEVCEKTLRMEKRSSGVSEL
jgi:hypothetical protein